MSIGSQSQLPGWDADPDRGHAQQLLSVARRYYEDQMSQAEIATAIGYSRPTVGRLLAQARREGIVQIQVDDPFERVSELERILAARFGINQVRVTSIGSTHDPVAEVGAACAEILGRVVAPGMSVGLSTGRMHRAVVGHLKTDLAPRDSTFVQLVGGLPEGSPIMDGREVCQRFAAAFGGVAVTMEAPLMATTKREARSYQSLPDVARSLAAAAAVDIAVVGVGAGFHHSTGVFDQVISTRHIRELRRRGAVGHILAQFFDHDGAVIANSVQELVVGLRIERLRSIPHVIAVATGAHKAEALAAALRGRLVDAVVLDYPAARALADYNKR